jgi:hypothetical protein
MTSRTQTESIGGTYHQATRPRLKLQWTHDDYADIESFEDEDTAYDHSTRVGRQVEAGLILDRVVCHLLYFYISICVKNELQLITLL